jgi:anti-sigma factor (TIGR02949 family)
LDCREVEQFLQFYLDGELDERDGRQVEEHLRGCAQCRARADYERRFVQAVKARVPREKAPESLQRRLRESLAAEGASRRLWRRLLLGGLPAAAALAAVIFTFTMTSGFAPLVEEAVRQHSRDQAVEINSSDYSTVEDWFRKRLAFHVALPRFSSPRVSLNGARLSRLASYQAAQVRFSAGDERYSLFIIDDPRLEPTGAKCRWLQERKVCFDERSGYTVLVWRARGLVYSLVGESPAQKLIETISLDSF